MLSWLKVKFHVLETIMARYGQAYHPFTVNFCNCKDSSQITGKRLFCCFSFSNSCNKFFSNCLRNSWVFSPWICNLDIKSIIIWSLNFSHQILAQDWLFELLSGLVSPLGEEKIIWVLLKCYWLNPRKEKKSYLNLIWSFGLSVFNPRLFIPFSALCVIKVSREGLIYRVYQEQYY